MSIEIGADPAPETYPNEAEHRALIARHSRSVGEAVRKLANIVWFGTISTTSNATTTTETVTGIKAGDKVFFSPADANAASFVAGWDGSADNGGKVYFATGNDAIYGFHPSFAGSASFNVMVLRP